ncbi:hypothetical protein [Roseiconus lacunae]|uniref:hypothetical protein n=1 Tax=Roseiconus lacunae TaxID=2605694 RepID=UPI001E2ED775|nr:hypothetical protein [Roseiconus lacunae]MCD0458757.1 hypothetical protein [Roseiconus lacunae]
MSDSNRRILRIDLRTLEKIDDEKLEKLEMLMMMVSVNDTDVEFLDSDESRRRDHALEAVVIEETIQELSRDNNNSFDVFESIAKQDANWRREQHKRASTIESVRDFAAWCERNKIPVIGKLLLEVLS